MAEAKKIDPEKITMREFRLVKGSIDSPFDFRISDIKSFDFKVQFEIGFNLEEELIKTDFIIDVSTVSNEPVTEATCNYHLVFLFHVTGLNDHVQLTPEGLTDCSPYLANAISSITYSTARGILMSRFQGTIMQDFILPVVDPNALLKNNISQRVLL